MTAPDDSDAVLGMVRLGWYIAEVRGRNRPDMPAGAPLKLPERTNHALPLERERSAPELRIEAQAVLKALADRAGVDQESSGASFGVAVDRAAKALATASDAGPEDTKTPAAPLAITAKADAPAEAATPGEAGTAGNGPAPPATEPGQPDGEGTAGEAAAPPGQAAGLAGPAAGLAGAVRRLAGAAKGLTDVAKPGGSGGAPKTGPDDGTVVGDWDSVANLIYKFDAHIQDTLAAQSVTLACGYQLGRALAECYWALDPSLPADSQTWASWLFLFGDERCGEIGRLVGRLSAYFHPYTAPGIAGSVQVWKNVARSPEWQNASYPTLYGQIRVWYELLLLKQDPTTLIKPYALLKNYRLVWRTLRGFWAQLVLAGLAAGAVAVFAWLLTQPTVSSWVKTLLAALGITGFSVAGLAAKVKNDAQAMLTRLKQDAYTDLIALAITTAPLPPRSVQAPRTGLIPPITKKGKMTAMMRQRSITPTTPA